MSIYCASLASGWLSENGYHRLVLPEHGSVPWQAENGATDDDSAEDTENGISTRYTLSRTTGYAARVPDDLQTNMVKRDKEVSWPVMVPRSLSDIRRNCCVRDCTAEDFYGACF